MNPCKQHPRNRNVIRLEPEQVPRPANTARQLIGSPLHGMNSQHRDSVAITTQPMRGDSCTRSRARPRRCHIQAADSEPTTPHTPHTTHHTIQRNTTTDKQQQHATMRLSSVEGKRLR